MALACGLGKRCKISSAWSCAKTSRSYFSIYSHWYTGCWILTFRNKSRSGSILESDCFQKRIMRIVIWKSSSLYNILTDSKTWSKEPESQDPYLPDRSQVLLQLRVVFSSFFASVPIMCHINSTNDKYKSKFREMKEIRTKWGKEYWKRMNKNCTENFLYSKL